MGDIAGSLGVFQLWKEEVWGIDAFSASEVSASRNAAPRLQRQSPLSRYTLFERWDAP
jgi:hypothetical protein